MTLEERVTAGRVSYVGKIVHDAATGVLEFELITDPEQAVVDRTLTFTRVENFRQDWDEEEDADLLEQIIGIHEIPHGESTRYLIRLGQSEITFSTTIDPTIEGVGAA